MNPAAPTFGPGGVGGMMYMPGGQGYFAPGTFPQAAGWQGGQYGQYGMGPAAAMQAAASAGAAGSQQGMAGGSTSMGAGPQQQPGSGGGYAAAGGAPKATPTVTPPRVRCRRYCWLLPSRHGICGATLLCEKVIKMEGLHCSRSLLEPFRPLRTSFCAAGEEDPTDRESGHPRGD